MPQQYLSTDPNEGAPVYLSTDPNEGQSSPSAPRSQIGDAVSATVREINPLPALAKANQEAAAIAQEALSGNLSSAALRAWNDVKGIAHGMGRAQGELAQRADAAFKAGDYVNGGRLLIDYLIPVFGPRMAASGDEMAKGNYGTGAGIAIGTGLNAFAPEAISRELAFRPRARAMQRPKPVTAPTPDAEAVQFAVSHDVPMSVGQATGNPVVRGVEQLNERSSLGGSVIARSARQNQAQAMTRVGGDLAERAAPAHVVPEQAGQAVRDAVTGRATAYHEAATAAYEKLRGLEAKAADLIKEHGGVKAPETASKPFTKVPLAVDVAPAKAALRPTYEALKREADLVPLMGGKARALTALDRLMQADDLAPLSVVDAALSDLKAMSRADQPFLRTSGQGVAAQAVTQLDKAVRRAAQEAGPEAYVALMNGRAATVNKFKAIDTLEKLRAEPVQVFRQATYAKDAGVNTLREIQRLAPETMPQIGRAFLDDLLAKATAEGGFGHGQSLYSQWQNLGPETKRILFKDPAYIKDLDNFFLFAKRAGESVNPSGSGFTATLSAKGVYTAMNPATGIPLELGQTALTKALWNPTLVKLLTRGLKTPARSAAGRSLIADLAQYFAPATAASRSIAGASPALAEQQPAEP